MVPPAPPVPPVPPVDPPVLLPPAPIPPLAEVEPPVWLPFIAEPELQPAMIADAQMLASMETGPHENNARHDVLL